MNIYPTKYKSSQNLFNNRKEAISTLIDLGVLIPFNEKLHLYHGRTSNDNDTFVIKNNMDNSGHYMGHYNVNAIPGLHASTKQIAELYANARTAEQYTKNPPNKFLSANQQTHKIVALTNNAKIFDVCKIYDLEDLLPTLKNFVALTEEDVNKLKSNRLSFEQEQQLSNAVSILASTYTIPKLLPNLFKDDTNIKVLKDLTTISKNNAKLGKQEYVFDDDVEKFLSKKPNSQLNQELVNDIAGAINVYTMLKNGTNLQMLFSKLQSGFDFTENKTLNLELFKNFLVQLNICGVHQKIWKSDIINLTNFDDYFFFDTSKINTEQIAKKIQSEQKEK